MSAAPSDLRPGPEVLAAWNLGAATLSPISRGNINTTLLVSAPAGDLATGGLPGGRAVLQRLNPIFSADVHHDIEALSAHIREVAPRLCGEATARLGHPVRLELPRLVRTVGSGGAGQLYVTDAQGGVWRLQTFVDGVVHDRADAPDVAAAAGELLGMFHLSLWGFSYTYRARRLGVHDTPKHLANLRAALTQRLEHDLFAVVRPVAEEILRRAAALPTLAALPERHVHGDPKINNMIFDAAGRGWALIDLDTLAPMPLALELGDALRSWCNPAGENEEQARLGIDHFAAALRGYASVLRGHLTAAEVEALAPGVETIALELAARFAADALNESYFGWDRRRFARAGEHNLLRAKSQLSLARSIADQRSAVAAAVRAAFQP